MEKIIKGLCFGSAVVELDYLLPHDDLCLIREKLKEIEAIVITSTEKNYPDWFKR